MPSRTAVRRCLTGLLFVLACPVQRSAPADASWVLNPSDLETVTLGGAGEDGGYNIHPTSDGGYIIAGCVTTPGRGRDLVVCKLRGDLTRDPAFGRAGCWVAGSTGDDQAIDVIEVHGANGRPDGFLVGGYVRAGDGDFAGCDYHGAIDIALARLTSDGKLDPRFGRGGLRLYGGSGDDELIVHLYNYSEPGDRLVQTEGGFVVGAMTRSNDGDLAGIATVGHAGSRDGMIFKIAARGNFVRDFADRGILRIGMEPGPRIGRRAPNDFVFSLKSEKGGGFVAAGYHFGVSINVGGTTVASPGNRTDIGNNDNDDVKDDQMDGWVFRIGKNGSLRPDWARRGLALIGGSRQEKIYDATPTSDGGCLVTGRTASWDLDFIRTPTGPDEFDMVLLKLDARGHLDRGFGHNGFVFYSGGEDNQGLRVLTLPGGDILWLGQSLARPAALADTLPAHSGRQVIMTHLTASGRVLCRWSLGGPGEDKPVGFCIDQAGRVVITGFHDPTVFDNGHNRIGPHRDLLVMRFDPGFSTPRPHAANN